MRQEHYRVAHANAWLDTYTQVGIDTHDCKQSPDRMPICLVPDSPYRPLFSCAFHLQASLHNIPRIAIPTASTAIGTAVAAAPFPLSLSLPEASASALSLSLSLLLSLPLSLSLLLLLPLPPVSCAPPAVPVFVPVMPNSLAAAASTLLRPAWAEVYRPER